MERIDGGGTSGGPEGLAAALRDGRVPETASYSGGNSHDGGPVEGNPGRPRREGSQSRADGRLFGGCPVDLSEGLPTMGGENLQAPEEGAIRRKEGCLEAQTRAREEPSISRRAGRSTGCSQPHRTD